MTWRPLLASAFLVTCFSTTFVGCSSEGTDEAGQDGNDADDSNADGSSGGGLACLENLPSNTTDGASDPIMNVWGSACETDADCVERLGEGAVCDKQAVVYELPGGYCTKPCELADGERVRMDDPACDPNGGVACIGQAPLYERCAVICTDDGQCNRDGYYCRQMPVIAQASDPPFCLMPDCCESTCADEE